MRRGPIRHRRGPQQVDINNYTAAAGVANNGDQTTEASAQEFTFSAPRVDPAARRASFPHTNLSFRASFFLWCFISTRRVLRRVLGRRRARTAALALFWSAFPRQMQLARRTARSLYDQPREGESRFGSRGAAVIGRLRREALKRVGQQNQELLMLGDGRLIAPRTCLARLSRPFFGSKNAN